ncbi:hypothetical protein ACLQ3K_02375 [Tsukamurella sp. DT100]|uniref:hypothetical protein n=1 Tax=Tsukamurella sp. DT100 TaxID=3393415 RepID=UPI003CEC79BE
MTGSKETVAATDAAIRRLAYRGRGILTARAAAAAGIHPEALFRAGKRGTVHATDYRGVYSVLPPELLSARDRLQAAWVSIDLTSPPWERVHQAANIVSHHTALDLHAGRQPAEPFEFVLGSTSRLINRPGIIAHRQPIEPDELTEVDGLPVQTVGTAIVDLMSTYRPHPEQAVSRLLASTVAAGADWQDVPARLGYVLGNPWSKHDTRQVLVDLFARTGANPALVRGPRRRLAPNRVLAHPDQQGRQPHRGHRPLRRRPHPCRRGPGQLGPDHRGPRGRGVPAAVPGRDPRPHRALRRHPPGTDPAPRARLPHDGSSGRGCTRRDAARRHRDRRGPATSSPRSPAPTTGS